MSAPPIRVFSTMHQTRVPLEPISPGKLGIYVCGPTVYGFIHIGNARTFTSFDTIVRYLRNFRGFEVRYVRNFTDVDDKIIKAAWAVGEWSGAVDVALHLDGDATLRHLPGTWWIDGLTVNVRAGDTVEQFGLSADGLSFGGTPLSRRAPAMSPIALAAYFVDRFREDVGALKLIEPDVAPKVSDTIPEIIVLVEKLMTRGVAYEARGDVYFEVRKQPDYLKLSRRKLDDLQAGARVEVDELKRDPADFALWKAAKPGEVAWDSPWGRGRPGWHIECSAMSSKYLGETFDLHGGGLDLIFPHHENEIAQSEGASGKTLCNCWMHGGFLDLEGAKMSKSLGNVVRLRDALQRVDAEALRYFFLSTHYRQALSFSDKQLSDADGRLEYFYETLKKVDERIAGKEFPPGPLHGDPNGWLTQFDEQMSDDFNVPGALGVLSGLFNELNLLCDKPPVKDKPMVGRTLVALRGVVSKISAALGLFEEVPSAWLLRRRDRQVLARGLDVGHVEQLIRDRDAARVGKNFTEADRLRGELKTLGVEIMDSPTGTTWKVLSA